MDRGSEKYYFEVAVILPATWQNNIYTYSSDSDIKSGLVVKVPFGKVENLGVVLKKVGKPKFATKNIIEETGSFIPLEAMNLLKWSLQYYPSSPGITVQHFLPAFLKKPIPVVAEKNKSKFKKANIPLLTKTQEKAITQINNTSKPTILHGVTGSGKTRMYCELALEELKKGNNVLILYPEISLTSQLEETLKEYFGEDIVNVYHSKRTPSQQRKSWINAHNSSHPSITIGPRSALFLPYSKLGLVVVDEAHDGAYKQDSGSRYSALTVAGKLAGIHSAKLLFGSATPPVQETQQILSKNGTLVCVHETAKDSLAHGDVNFAVVDMSDKKNTSKSSMLSVDLVGAINKSLADKAQSLLFLNRRGTARMLLCEKCGWHAECSRCDSPLTYHHDTHTLQCHLCGFKQRSVQVCPECNNAVTQRTLGTKAIEAELGRIFPTAKIGRFDSDNKKNDSFTENYNYIHNGNVDIILGTQLISKGLDLPLLDTVGILQADSALLLPDYTSEERAFQQLTQVSGRVGRGHTHGTVVIQTYQPSNPLFKVVTEQDWHTFYDEEIERRKKSGYPPFSFAVKIWTSQKTREKSQLVIQKIVNSLKNTPAIRILGPAPSFYEKTAGKYSWQIVVLSGTRSKLAELTKNLPKNCYFDLDPVSLL